MCALLSSDTANIIKHKNQSQHSRVLNLTCIVLNARWLRNNYSSKIGIAKFCFAIKIISQVFVASFGYQSSVVLPMPKDCNEICQTLRSNQNDCVENTRTDLIYLFNDNIYLFDKWISKEISQSDCYDRAYLLYITLLISAGWTFLIKTFDIVQFITFLCTFLCYFRHSHSYTSHRRDAYMLFWVFILTLPLADGSRGNYVNIWFISFGNGQFFSVYIFTYIGINVYI